MNEKISALFAGLCLAASLAPAEASTNKPVEQFIAAYSQAHQQLGLGAEMELSYVKNIEHLLKHNDVAAQLMVLDELSRQLKALDQAGSDRCQQLQLHQIGFELALNQQKLAVLGPYLLLGERAILSEQGLAKTSLGKDWYAYLRRAWLTMDSTPEALMAMGHSELERALKRYRELQARMGYGGRDKAFAAYLDSPAFSYPDGETPQADYEARQAIVYKHMHKLFLPTAIAPPQIRRSDLGAALPVDGYYEPDENTFYFNRAQATYGRRNIDWLLLHESTPGHHYQSRYALEQRGCPVGLPHGFYSAFAEGWGAYVEEFGGELGLFQQDSDALGAVEWDLVRSIRVVLDVGINAFGWSEQQAQDFWRSKLPMLPHLAEREITRVRNWPAQAITYKQGAVMLRQLREAAREREGAAFDIRVFHDKLLKHGPLPLALLADALEGEGRAVGPLPGTVALPRTD
ncbi:DUF885 domain-containing protein [Roseateles oligotrophus]|uniref:DUF885 domain-containing protein n=1 Tax=Roseateles oligotrophus TaxID=1769250 RepID=A0ABT2YL05_9BURK|nr:DUF885 domain-containing protein [Roseateles oligotrophus]MCV2370751.1 DUF885 domain-containing protein [Roseateles oligotrophus]